MESESIVSEDTTSTDVTVKQVSRLQIARTVFLYMTYLSLGMAAAIYGPTLQDLATGLHTDTRGLAFINIAKPIGFIFGGVIGGSLFDKWNRQVLFMIVIMTCFVTTLLTPWARDATSLCVLRSVATASFVTLDSACNVWCLDLWQERAAPFLLALHFSYGLGAFVVPFIAEPFNRPPQPTAAPSIQNSSEINITSTLSPSIDNGYYAEYSYGIVSGFVLITWIYLVVITIIDPTDKRPDRSSFENKKKNTDTKFVVIILAIAILYLTAYSSFENDYGELLATFAVKSNLKLSEGTGSFMTSVFYGMITAGRLLSVVIAAKVSIVTIIVADQILMTASTVFLLIFANNAEWALWTGTAFIGLGMSSFYPSVVNWIEQHVTINNKVAAILITCSGLGEAGVSFLVQNYIDQHPSFFLVTLLVLSCIVFALFFFLQFLFVRDKRRAAYEIQEDSS